MTEPLDPEIKALRALERAWTQVPAEAEQRTLQWFTASRCDVAFVVLPSVVPRVSVSGGAVAARNGERTT